MTILSVIQLTTEKEVEILIFSNLYFNIVQRLKDSKFVQSVISKSPSEIKESLDS